MKVLGSLEPSELSSFYSALDEFMNLTLRPQRLKVGTVATDKGVGYTSSPM